MTTTTYKTYMQTTKSEAAVILGIDPGIGRVGWGVVHADARGVAYDSSGCITTDKKLKPADRMAAIAAELKRIVSTKKPHSAVVEKLFFAKNKKTALLVAEARGVIMLTLRELGVQTLEFTPLEVKMAVVGNGRAEKRQVAWVVKNMLKLRDSVRSDDELDALALCLLGSPSRV